MMIYNDIVDEQAERPNGERGECFYCRQPIGERHKDGCVIRTRRVRVKATIEYEVEVPADWDASMIDFHFNESSWCTDNILDDLSKDINRREAEGRECLCGSAEFDYLGEVGDRFPTSTPPE